MLSPRPSPDVGRREPRRPADWAGPARRRAGFGPAFGVDQRVSAEPLDRRCGRQDGARDCLAAGAPAARSVRRARPGRGTCASASAGGGRTARLPRCRLRADPRCRQYVVRRHRLEPQVDVFRSSPAPRCGRALPANTHRPYSGRSAGSTSGSTAGGLEDATLAELHDQGRA